MNKIKKFIIVIILLIIYKIRKYFLNNPTLKGKTLKSTRKLPNKNSKLIELSNGNTHYIIDAPKNILNKINFDSLKDFKSYSNKPLIVLIHGFAGSSDYFNYLNDYLVKKNRIILRIDLIGRGLSECKDLPHTSELFSSQICEILYKLDYHDKIDLIGYSMGKNYFFILLI